MKNSETLRILTVSLALLLAGWLAPSIAAPNETDQDTLLFQNWESGWGNWWADNGLWEVGIATVGPDSAYSPQNCAGTDLDDNYPGGANTRLVSPQFIVPAVAEGEYVSLQFWHWFRIAEDSYFGYDNAYVQVQVNGGSWQTLLGPISGLSTVWTQVIVNLSQYADSTLRVAFYFTSGTYVNDNGWYVDNILIVKKPVIFNNPEPFSWGMGDWWADNGLWEVGIPTAGPSSAHSPPYCAGTVLNGSYPGLSNTRLISPEITLTPSGALSPELYYWHWYRLAMDPYFGNDYGYVQISVNGGDWQNISIQIYGYNETWSQGYADLSPYVNQKIRIAFYLVSGTYVDDVGWYIDDVRIENSTLGMDEPSPPIEFPNSFKLFSPHPNPFNPVTSLSFDLPRDGVIELSVFDLQGREVAQLARGWHRSGTYEATWNAENLTSGVYLARLQTRDFVGTQKLVLLK